VKDILVEEYKKKKTEKQSQVQKDQLNKSEDLSGGGSGGKQEPDDPRNAGKIKTLVNARDVRCRLAGQDEVLSSLIVRLSWVFECLEKEKSGSFFREHNPNSVKAVDPVLFEKVRQNLVYLNGVLEDLKGTREFLRQQKITNDEEVSYPSEEPANSQLSTTKEAQNFKNAVQLTFWPPKSKIHSLSESIDRVSAVYKSLSYAVGEYDKSSVNSDDRSFAVLLSNLRVIVGGSLTELASVIDFLQDKLETGESLYDPSDEFIKELKKLGRISQVG